MNFSEFPIPTIASIFFGFAVFLFLGTFFSGPLPAHIFQKLPPLEQQRRTRVRDAKPIYKRFERIIQDLRPLASSFSGEAKMRDLKKAFQFSSVYQHMEPDEFLSLKLIEASIAGALVGLILGFSLGPVVGLASFLVVVAVYIPLAENETRGISSQTKNRFLLRLPNAVDLLSLMLEAGATFPDALDTVVNENKGHPLGDQFGQVAREMALGRPRSESLRALRERMDDIVVDELIMAINEGEELGTPLAKILSSQAERMRLKKSQWIEKAAAEAQVKMAFPSLLIMIACSLVVLGPFVLQAVFQFLGE